MQSQMTSRTLLPTASFSLRPQRLSQRCSAFRARVRHARSVRSVAASEQGTSAQEQVQESLFFVAMNNFKVNPEKGTQFEQVWKERKSTLLDTPGFIRFALLKGDEAGEYISESVWASRADFDNWRNSQSFGAAHGSSEGKAVGPAASKTGDMMRGPPVAKFYEAVTVTEQTLF